MAIAVAVLAGALLVGESVRASLRDLVLQRLGNTERILSGSTFFRQELAEDLGGAPVIALDGIVTTESTRRRASGVHVWGIDERFWRFHGRTPLPRGVYASEALASELDVSSGDAVQLSFPQPSAIPAESLHGRKDESLRAVRLSLTRVLPAAELGDFSLQPRQGAVRSLFVPIETLAHRRANVVLLGRSAPPLNEKLRLDDIGVRLRPLAAGFAVESESTILSDALASAVQSAAARAGARSVPVFAYLANEIRSGGKEIPYSLVAATDEAGVSRDAIALNEWAARELGARAGDPIEIDYYVWSENGRLETESASFRLERVLPMQGLGADRELAPEYPGITGSDSVSDWDPPFPIDLSRIRPADEEYWKRYRAAPKAFLALARGQELWVSRFGKLTSVRIDGITAEQFEPFLRAEIQPGEFGLALENVRTKSLEAAAGATDFGEYFTYFSFFLVIAALLLAGLFFRFGVEQRVREIGTLRALGFSRPAIARLLLSEAGAVVVLAAALGIAGAVGYAALIVYALRTWWVDAVGTTLLSVHVSALPLAYGAVGGAAAGLVFLLLSLRCLRRMSPRALLAGASTPAAAVRLAAKRARWASLVALGAAAGVLLLAGRIGQTAAFFGAGSLLLAAALCGLWSWLVRPSGRALDTLARLGFRYAAYRPGRSTLTIALIAFAAFVIVAVDSFRRGGERIEGLIAESVLPVYYDLNTPEGREQLNLTGDALAGAEIDAFRLRAGEDASCLNLYRPQDPRVAAPPRSYLSRDPWRLLESPVREGAIPALVDSNSLRYVFHRKLGDVIDIRGGVRLRFVGALTDSVFQSEVLISPGNFTRAFPHNQGYRLFLIRARDEGRVAAALEEALEDYGLDAVPARERLAAFHRVENTYLSTFQALGALGLLLGTAGLGAVLLRNVIERRRETALLRAVGYTPRSIGRVLLAEAVLLLVGGLAAGTLAALVAVAPAWLERGGRPPFLSIAALLAAVLVTGVAASLAALKIALRSPLLAALRSE